MSQNRKKLLLVALLLVNILVTIVGFRIRSDGDQRSIGLPATTKNNSCPKLVTPVDMKHVSAILYPGQIRGGDFKPHGGFRMDNTDNNLVDVVAPLDAKITLASRYIEMGEIQYLFEFENSCGLKYRFDHLKTLSAKLQAIADKLPTAKVDDSRTTRVKGNIAIAAGEIVATAAGFTSSPHDVNQPNVAFDFGLYDTRQKNEASKDSVWVSAHIEEGDQAIYAVCWLNWLPSADMAIAKSLPGGDSTNGKKSDYCN